MLSRLTKYVDKSETFRQKRLVIALFGFIYCITGIAHHYINVDIVLLALWILFCFTLFVLDLRFFLKYVIYFFYLTTNVVGVYIIENQNFYLYEMGRYSARVNSMFLITFVHWLFIFVLYVADARIEKKYIKKRKQLHLTMNNKVVDSKITILIAIAFNVVCLYLLLRAIANPAARLQVDRFIYQHDYISGLWGLFNSYVPYLLPIFVIIIYKKRKIPYVIASVLLYFVYLFLIGHKFGMFLSTIVLFLPYLIERYNLSDLNIKNLRTVLRIGAIVIVALSIAIYMFMRNTYETSKTLFTEYLYQRLAAQGQMWWGTFEHEKGAGLHFDELFVSMGSFFGLNEDVLAEYNFGIYKLMKMITPSYIYVGRMESYSRYAFSTEASLYYYFKSVGLLLFMSILALLLSYITNWYWKEIRNRSWFGAIVSGRMYVLILSVLLQSDFNILFSKKILLMLLLYAVIRVYPKYHGKPVTMPNLYRKV